MNYKYEIEKIMTKIIMAIVWRLPKKLCYWVTVRVIASATTGVNSSVCVPELLAMDALILWSGE